MKHPGVVLIRFFRMISTLRFYAGGVSIHDAVWSGAEAVSGQRLALEAGSVVFIRSGVLRTSRRGFDLLVDANHSLAVARPVVCAPGSLGAGGCTIFHFDRQALAMLPSGGDDVAAMLSPPGMFLRQWHALCWTRSRHADASLLERAVTRLSAELLAAFNEQPRARAMHYAALVSRAILELNGNCDVPLRLESLAAAFRMSPFTLSRAFHREVGISIRHYGKRLRLRKALQLMLDSDAELSSIAMDLGFFDQAHFSNAFREDFGIPPSLVLAAHRRAEPAAFDKLRRPSTSSG